MDTPVANATWSPVTTPLNVKMSLKFLIAYSSLQEVHSSFQEILHEEYSFLHTLFGTQSTPVRQVAQDPPPTTETSQPVQTQSPLQPQESEDLTSNSRIRSDRKIRIVKKSGLTDLEVGEAAVTSASQGQIQEPPFTQNEGQKEQSEKQGTPSKFRDPKDIKKWQKEQEEEKNAELVSKGVDPKSLLTRENLQRWVEVEGKGYAQIARDYVGLSEDYISAIAKSFGIQSVAAKRRAAVIAAQKRKGFPG
jgi:hypothetical protein